MNILRTRTLIVAIALFSLSMQACKTKKIVAKPTPPVAVEKPAPAPEKPAPVPVEETTPAPEEKTNFNFSNVQFEFNSDVLKTASFDVLDQVVRALKQTPSAKLTINGNSSAEGTPEHNMSLSVDRANSVKSYLINAGVSASSLTVKGFGAKNPITSNTTEEGKALNRRVEFKVSQ